MSGKRGTPAAVLSCGRSGSSLRDWRGARVALKPALKDEQRPQLLPVVTAAGKVVLDDPVDHLRLEIALPPKPVLGQNIKKQLAKGTLEPPGNRDAETLLRPVEYCLRKDPTHGALEDVLRAPAVEFDGERQLKNVFDEVHIEQRYPRFE